MSDRAEVVIFWILAVPLVVAAAGVVVARNAVNAAMCLVAAFFCLAGVYVLLTAHLLAFLQVLIYAGAIMVLFLFVIMLLVTSGSAEPRERVKVMQVLGAAAAVGVGAVVIRAVIEAGALPMRTVGPEFGTVKAVGRLLFTQYLLPFEATSILLLVAIVGAVVVAKGKI